MAETSTIEWTDATWNPVVGCDIVSPGCTNCYAMGMASRIEAMSKGLGRDTHYAGTTRPVKGKAVWTGKLALAPEEIRTAPLRWKKPRMVFVNSMGDLFHESVRDEWIDQVFAVMALAPQHTFQVLTKRSARMREYASDEDTPARIAVVACELWATQLAPGPKGALWIDHRGDGEADIELQSWPLPNVWLGVSAERQAEADERVPDLLATPAEIRFVSAEPLLGPIDFTRINLGLKQTSGYGPKRIEWDALTGWEHQFPHDSEPGCDPLKARFHGIGDCGADAKLDWIIVGGESGPGARPMHPDWARAIRDQCQAAGVPFFFKQWGEHVGGEGEDSGDAIWFEAASAKHESRWLRATDDFDWFDPSFAPFGPMHLRLRKKAAGRLLDGVEHSAMPAPKEVPAL